MKIKKDFRRDAKVLAIDLEVAPSRVWCYGLYKPKVVKVDQPPVLLAFSWKWLGEKKTHGLTILDKGTVDRFDDGRLVKELWKLLDECNVAVAFNGRAFDFKMVNTFFVRHNMTPPTPYKVFDPIQVAWSQFRFDCNKLDYLGKLLLGVGKTKQTYGDCWEDLLLGESKKVRKQASETMKIYCNRDVELLEKVYEKLLPWSDNHPNMALLAGNPNICPRCGNSTDFKIKAYRRTGTQVNGIQYQCKHCGAYVTRRLEKYEREDLDEQGKLKSVFRNIAP